MRYHELSPGNDEEVLDEARLGTAVRLDELPPQYRKLPVIGRGTTSVVVEEDSETVLVFTRDRMKLDWLIDQEIGTVIDEYDSYKNHVRGMSALPIYVIRMAKLHKLSPENSRLVRKACNEVSQYQMTTWRKSRSEATEAVIRHFHADERHILKPLWDFLINYDGRMFSLDIGPRNFMQTADGKLVKLDPIASTEIIDLVMNDKKAREVARDSGYGRW